MEYLTKLERTVAGWLKNVPHLPLSALTWLGDNVWWIAIIGAVVTGLGAIGLFGTISAAMSVLGSPVIYYYTSTSVVSATIITSLVSLVFLVIECILLAFAVSPLKEKQRKGWVLLFATWCVGVVSTAVTALLTFNTLSIIGSLIFGALWAAVTAYFIFEVRDQFAHVERSRGVKGKKVA